MCMCFGSAVLLQYHACFSHHLSEEDEFFYKKLLCYNNVVLYTVCKLAADELQRLSSLYCVNLCVERLDVVM